MRLLDVDDGYTQTAVVGEETIVFRPILAGYRDRLFNAFSKSSGSDIRECLMRHVVDGVAAAWSCDASKLLKIICNLDNLHQERADADNLAEGVWLELRHPEVASRPCELCKVWWYKADGSIYRRAGKIQKRPEGSPLPCETQEGCPKGSPDRQRSLSEKNRRAYEHYLECRAICKFPDDPVVRHNAQIIRRQEQEFWAWKACKT